MFIKFVEKNWFKIAIIIIFALAVFIYWDKSKEDAPSEVKEVQKTIALETVPTPKVETIKATPKESEEDPNLKVTSQLKIFDDYLEYDLIGASLDCLNYAVYNNVAASGSMNEKDFKQAFPETKEYYKNQCSASYLSAVKNQKLLIAEPELQPLRVLLTSYAEEVKGFSLWALEGGYATMRIDSSDTKMDNFRVLSREEIVKLKRTYKY